MNATTCPPTEPLVLDLYRRHFDELRHFLGRRLDCPEAGRDAAQEIFLRLLINPPAVDIRNPRAFLLRSARNFLIDLGRAAQSRPQLVVVDET
ncbi:MAG TPA: sigma factor, partial [Azonexus sp.]|nr:sigma factor [Azonexus sp.]